MKHSSYFSPDGGCGERLDAFCSMMTLKSIWQRGGAIFDFILDSKIARNGNY